MAFVFRGDKPQALNKINPNLGPGNLFNIQVLTTLKCSVKIKFLKHMFLLVVWNQSQNSPLITQHL